MPCLPLRPTAADKREIVHDGETRRLCIEHPLGSRPAPAIVILHGGAGNANRMRRIAKFTLYESGWVEIYPAGIDRRWNDGRTGADGRPLRKTDNLGFLRAMANELISEGQVDPTRVFFAGVSNGGAMTLRAICQAPDLVAGQPL